MLILLLLFFEFQYFIKQIYYLNMELIVILFFYDLMQLRLLLKIIMIVFLMFYLLVNDGRLTLGLLFFIIGKDLLGLAFFMDVCLGLFWLYFFKLNFYIVSITYNHIREIYENKDNK
jgi:hypothetical protein